jgi:hypothetical protein
VVNSKNELQRMFIRYIKSILVVFSYSVMAESFNVSLSKMVESVDESTGSFNELLHALSFELSTLDPIVSYEGNDWTEQSIFEIMKNAKNMGFFIAVKWLRDDEMKVKSNGTEGFYDVECSGTRFSVSGIVTLQYIAEACIFLSANQKTSNIIMEMEDWERMGDWNMELGEIMNVCGFAQLEQIDFVCDDLTLRLPGYSPGIAENYERGPRRKETKRQSAILGEMRE